MKKCRLIYKSLAKAESLKKDALHALIETASKNNEEAGITGMLLLTGNQFLQVLEGPSRFVNQIYNKIVNDERHSEVELISYEMIDATLFCDWTMKLMDLRSLAPHVHSLMLKKYPHTGDTINLPTNLITTLSLLVDARNVGLTPQRYS